MEVLIWILGIIAWAVFKGFKEGFPKMPDGRNDTPLGPHSGRRTWPSQAEPRPQPGTWPRQTQAAPRPGEPYGRPIEMGETNDHYGGPVAPTIFEPHETVQPTVRDAPDYRNEKRTKPSADAERVFSGQSSYDRMGSHPVGRPVRGRAPVRFEQGDLVRAVVMAEILGPPRSKKPGSNLMKLGRRNRY